MQRLLMDKLVEWKSRQNRKPLILWGARQTGKTWLMKEFGRTCYSNVVYISFYNNRRAASIFDRDYDPERIVRAIEIEYHTTINPQNTLLIFDEIQNAPKAVEALKCFCEDAPQYSVISAGSLLGVALHEGISFPVGKVDELRLYPLSFREYLLARGENALAGFLGGKHRPETAEFHERYVDFLREYMFVGGMPEVVSSFCENRDLEKVRELQLAIVNQYEGDFGKHAPATQIPRIRMVWNSVPVQLAKENRKFFFGQIKKGGRMTDFEIAIQWLADAGLLYKVCKVEKPGMPLKSYVDLASFKIFIADIGLLGAMSELNADSILHGNEIFTEFKGALTEQFVLQQLVSSTDYTPYYYSGEKSTYETDFLIQKGGLVIPIEVKAEENLRSKSLRFFYDKFSPAYAVRVSMADYRNQEWMVNIPLWDVESV